MGFRGMPEPESVTSSRVPSLISYFFLNLAGIVVCPFLVTSTSSVMIGQSTAEARVLHKTAPYYSRAIGSISNAFLPLHGDERISPRTVSCLRSLPTERLGLISAYGMPSSPLEKWGLIQFECVGQHTHSARRCVTCNGHMQ